MSLRTAMKVLGLSVVVALSLITGSMGSAVASPLNDPRFSRDVTLETDKTIYFLGENVIISGKVASDILRADEPVVLQVFSPVEELAKVEAFPASNGNFSYVLHLDQALMNIPSGYDILATYAGANAGETFYFMPEGMVEYECGFGSVCQHVLNLNNTRYEVDYKLNGIIQNITVDAEANSLIIDALVYSNASFLDLSLNPELIRATEMDQTGQERNVNFTILVNGKNAEKVRNQADSEIIQLDQDRRLFVSKLEEGQNRVEIIGTKVVPEFSSVGLAVMAVTVAGVLIWIKAYSERKKTLRGM